jgi:predicted lipid-binding transport protein (Tim44 family)
VSNYLDLIVFGMIALFLALRLRSILGRRTGFERPAPQAPVMMRAAQIIDGTATQVPIQPLHPLPDPNSPVGHALLAIKQVESSFDPGQFLMGAESAFRLIVTAFAAGDSQSLERLLTPETYQAFESAIKTRQQAGETQVSDIKTVLDAIIENASLRPGPNGAQIADITVRFASHQVNLTKDKDGSMLTGSDGITEMVDIWGFERVLGSAEPTWRLASAQSA